MKSSANASERISNHTKIVFGQETLVTTKKMCVYVYPSDTPTYLLMFFSLKCI